MSVSKHISTGRIVDIDPAEEQEHQFQEPYHYLPVITKRGFRQHRHWSWGYRYLGRLSVVIELLKDLSFTSLLDLGCGDGRFLSEVNARFEGKTLCGIDSSKRAIAHARRCSPGIDYQCSDILIDPPNSEWDVTTLLEVLEHIPKPDLAPFVSTVARLTNPGGAIILTVPHLNEKLISKHYQHFDRSKLEAVLTPEFTISRIVMFDYISPMMTLFSKLMGGSGRHFVITNQRLNNFFYRYYRKHCLYGSGKNHYKRIAVCAYKR